jgi:hypothetical protein
MSWFGFGRKHTKWHNVLPMLYPFELDTGYIDQTGSDPATVERNQIASIDGPLGLRVYLLDQSQDGVSEVVNNGLLEDWGIEIDALYHEAIKNLEREILPNIETVRLENSPNEIAFLRGGGSYISSLLMVDTLWKKIGFRQEDVVVAIPHRELLFFGNADSGATKEQLKVIVEETFANESVQKKHLLFDGLAIYNNGASGHWKPLILN